MSDEITSNLTPAPSQEPPVAGGEASAPMAQEPTAEPVVTEPVAEPVGQEPTMVEPAPVEPVEPITNPAPVETTEPVVSPEPEAGAEPSGTPAETKPEPAGTEVEPEPVAESKEVKPEAEKTGTTMPASVPVVPAAPVGQEESVRQTEPIKTVPKKMGLPVGWLDKFKAKLFKRKAGRLEKIMAMAIKKGSIKNDQVEKLLHISDATASRYLTELVKAGRLKMISKKEKGIYGPN